MSNEISTEPQRKKLKQCEDSSIMELLPEETVPSPCHSPKEAHDSEEDIFFDCSPIIENSTPPASKNEQNTDISIQIEGEEVARAMEMEQKDYHVSRAERCRWRGISLADISKGCDSPQLPPITPSDNHTVLFKLPWTRGKVPEAHPRNLSKARDAWDSEHVRMPCSPQSLYAVTNSEGKNGLKGRWEMVCKALSKPITTSHELQEAILSYNSKYADRWDFSSLHSFFNEVMDEEESAFFFTNLLPKLTRLALDLPSIVTSPIPLLRQHREHSISLSQHQASALLANAFLCTFPRRNTSQKTSEYARFPDINFNRLFGQGRSASKTNVEKLKCIFNYFRRILDKTPDGVITFSRRYVDRKYIPRWDRSSKRLPRLHVTSHGTIEDQGGGMLQVDFANSFVGGGVLGRGCVQEEIRFLICPELILSRLFTEELDATEALLITGCERYSRQSGYADSFLWSGDYIDETPRDSSGRRHCSVVAIDALYLHNPDLQFSSKYLLRELNKAYIGFHNPDIPAGEKLSPVATGNWGCGAFRGKATLKALIQLMSAAEAGRNVTYFTFRDHELRDQIYDMHTFLVEENVTVGRLWHLLCRYHEVNYRNGEHTKDLYAYLYLAVLGKEKVVVQTTLDGFQRSSRDSTSQNGPSSSAWKQTERSKNKTTPTKKADPKSGSSSVLDSDDLKKALESLPDFDVEFETPMEENTVKMTPKSTPSKMRLFEALDSCDGTSSASNSQASSKFLEAYERRQKMEVCSSDSVQAVEEQTSSELKPVCAASKLSAKELVDGKLKSDPPQQKLLKGNANSQSRNGNSSGSDSGTSTPKRRISDYFQSVSKPT